MPEDTPHKVPNSGTSGGPAELTEELYLDIVDRTERALLGDRSVLPQLLNFDLVLLLGSYRDRQREIERLKAALEKWRPAIERGRDWYEKTGNEREARGFTAMLLDFDAALGRENC